MKNVIRIAAILSGILLVRGAAAQSNDATARPTDAPADPSLNEVQSSTTATAAIPTRTNPVFQDLPTTETVSPINRPLMVSGLVLLGGGYAAAAVVAGTSQRPEEKNNLFIPVAGPWMAMAERDCNAHPCGQQTLDTVLLAVDGVAQGLGALGIVTSLFLPEKATRRWYVLGDNVELMPTHVGLYGYGLGATGRF
jgi:hypothetical protein